MRGNSSSLIEDLAAGALVVVFIVSVFYVAAGGAEALQEGPRAFGHAVTAALAKVDLALVRQ